MTTRSVAKRRQRKTRKEWAAECRGHLRKTAEGLIGLGKTLTKAKRDLDQHGEWLSMLRDDLNIDVRFAQRVMALARNPRFSKASNLTHLPHALSALAELARLSDEDYEAAKASGAINPSMTAKQASRFVTVPVVRRRVKIESVAYVSPTEPFKGWGSGERRHTIEPVPPQRHAVIDAQPPDPLIADLAHIEDQLHDRLDGDRLERALAGLEQIRKAIAEPTRDNVVPLSSVS
jgi:hypothetical protein